MGSSNFAFKYNSMVEVTDSGKRSSLLGYGKNYGRKKFYSTGTRRESQKTFGGKYTYPLFASLIFPRHQENIVYINKMAYLYALMQKTFCEIRSGAQVLVKFLPFCLKVVAQSLQGPNGTKLFTSVIYKCLQ
jgi:hypothetical protein